VAGARRRTAIVEAVEAEDIVAIAVRDAIDGLPEDLARRVDNVAVEIADEEPGHPEILGLYQGISLPRRRAYVFALPDRITIFRRPLERLYGHDPALLRERTMHVVRHEFAHHFGISDERLREIGRY
jgi:predicted Zn-dependent protease with MMP-like domain